MEGEKGGEKMNRKILVFALLLLLVFTLIPTSMFLTASGASPYTEIFGTLNGANYVIRIPNPIENWNRNLVVYCHGYSHLEVNVSTFITTSLLGMDSIIANGYAIAASTYGAGGYCVQKGIDSTYQLTQYVVGKYNVTGKVFLYGISMGGNIALLASQKYPQLYNGVLDLSGSKDLADAYNTKMDFLAAKDDADMASKLQAINAPVPPYPFSVLYPPPLSLQLSYWRAYCNQSAADIALECGGTPQNASEGYIKSSPTGNANILRPVITVHGDSDALVPISQTLKYQAAVAAAGHSNLYRLYIIPGGQHVDAPITNELIPRLLELNKWSNTLDGWTLVTDAREMKGYPDLNEYIWQKTPNMLPNGQYDKIGLHRLIKEGITPKGVFLSVSGSSGNGEATISNPPTDSFVKSEDSYPPIYWANRGFDVYYMDQRSHFVPPTLNASQLSFMANWGWDQWISDMREVVLQVKEISGAQKIFIGSGGNEAPLNYATLYPEDLAGIIMLEPSLYGIRGSSVAVKRGNETNAFNLTRELSTMNSFGNWSTPGAYNIFKSAADNPESPVANETLKALGLPLINPLTNKTWANVTEASTYLLNYAYGSAAVGALSNVYGGYGNAAADIRLISQMDRYGLPARLKLESQAMADWVNCPYVTHDFDDNWNKINVPLISFNSQLYSNMTGTFRFVNGLGTADFTGVMLPKYGQLDVAVGTYAARDVFQPVLDWMVNHLPLDLTFFGNKAVGTVFDQNDANAQSVSYFTCTKPGVVTNIMAYISGVSQGNCIAALNAVNQGSAGALLAQSNPVNIGTTFSWVDFRLPKPYTVTAGMTYGLALMGDVHVNLMIVPGTGQRDHNAVSSYAKGFANPFGLIWGTDDRGAMSIYATGINTSTFGNTNIGTYQDGNDANAKSASYFTCSYTGTVTNIFAYVAREGGAGDGAAAIYADNVGSPGALIAATDEATIGTAFSWVNFPLLSPVSVAAGTGYWLAISSNNGLNMKIVDGSGVRIHNGVLSWFSDPFGPVWCTHDTGAMSIYASGVPMPTSSPTLTTQEQVRDAVMSYIRSRHPETAKFMTNLDWIGGRATPPNLTGAETYMYYSQGWNVTINYPVYPNPIYKITADYSAIGISIPYRIIWKGTMQNELVNETSYVFAQ
jgi:pimeloyl-ACP methyl ester carboxylesterase